MTFPENFNVTKDSTEAEVEAQKNNALYQNFDVTFEVNYVFTKQEVEVQTSAPMLASTLYLNF